MEAVRSRFYICEVRTLADGVRCLGLIKPSKRGTDEDQLARLGMFRKFRAGFDASIGKYSRSSRAVDYAEDLNSAKDRELELESERYEGIRMDALMEFSRWFWSSVAGGFANYLKQLPWKLDNVDAGADLLRDNADLKEAVKACLYFGLSPPLISDSLA